MTFNQKVHAIKCSPRCEMETSKVVCIEDACELYEKGDFEYSDKRLEKAASYAWGFFRPAGWTAISEDENDFEIDEKLNHSPDCTCGHPHCPANEFRQNK